ncbi:hypothetical protein COCMIDRAFT_10004 [Bipolaris oryzae ATCC 44560]|uniref:Uncharacterized protein n=1 Tax=Bipolaris oryzae ATCC 44560 TaxID=930090 RepID=W6YWZ3_COCMI|nr:uncharacterized protein COCMIDRAFT_10004 [Bipolaris oryzae ATCC 44560]EUC40044.1 hypothetical protein COCMIDRAFT_10004 [Bipolaris oryzae ATCC 44560]
MNFFLLLTSLVLASSVQARPAVLDTPAAMTPDLTSGALPEDITTSTVDTPEVPNLDTTSSDAGSGLLPDFPFKRRQTSTSSGSVTVGDILSSNSASGAISQRRQTSTSSGSISIGDILSSNSASGSIAQRRQTSTSSGSATVGDILSSNSASGVLPQRRQSPDVDVDTNTPYVVTLRLDFGDLFDA